VALPAPEAKNIKMKHPSMNAYQQKEEKCAIMINSVDICFVLFGKRSCKNVAK
jgi:hypothetical protein